MTNTRLSRQTMSAQISDMLRHAILIGEYEPGASVTESALALRFGASRGPLREAMRELVEEGLLVNVPYTGTRVVDISLKDINDIYAMRICLEKFAFEAIWPRRTETFRSELTARNAALKAAIDAGDNVAAIEAELDLHGLVYEQAGNRILLNSWTSLRGLLQMYWASHHRAHGMAGPKRESHDDYVRIALGDCLTTMHSELSAHMQRGLETTKAFVEARAKAKTEQMKNQPTGS